MPNPPAELRPRDRPPGSARSLLVDRVGRRVEAAEAALAEPFKGVTTGGTLVTGLFPVRVTGVSTSAVKQAAEAFLASLSSEGRLGAVFDVDSEAWRQWSNIHPFVMRHGALLDEASPSQRDLALALMRESLSPQGFETARNVMRLNETIREITGRDEEYGDWLYWLSVMGTPSDDEPWGWQIDGHHLIVNCFVLGDQVVMTPTFMGSEPCVADSGKYAGTRVFEQEERVGLALMQAMDAKQRAKALVSDDLPGDVFTTAFRDNFELRYEGVRYDELASAEQVRLLALIETYVGRARHGHAQVKMDEVKAHLRDTYFAWMGGCEKDSVFYYRVHSPVVLIEFDHQSGVALDNDGPSRNHVHTVVRTPNGNDYGKDLLRQHREQTAHPAA